MNTALITGASSGIGETFARELAAQNTNLILVARSQDKLDQLAQQLQTQHPIQAEVIVQDLTAPGACQSVFERVMQQGLQVDLLINNAGFGDYGNFTDRPLEKQVAMIQLNVTALVELTHLFLPGMKQRQSGGIINLASIAAFQPLPYISVYAATKALYSASPRQSGPRIRIPVSSSWPSAQGQRSPAFLKWPNFLPHSMAKPRIIPPQKWWLERR